jgi:hypothetical protein
VAFTVISAARLPLLPPLRAGPLTTLQTSRNAADRPVAPPYRAFDAGLRHRAFPPDAASLLPGLLAATRTGLTPASDDELTNTKIHHGVTSRCHLPLCWAHELTGLGTGDARCVRTRQPIHARGTESRPGSPLAGIAAPARIDNTALSGPTAGKAAYRGVRPAVGRCPLPFWLPKSDRQRRNANRRSLDIV